MVAGASVPPLGSAWLAANSQGKLGATPERDALRGDLLRELAMRPGIQVTSAIQQEVDKFLQAGRVSASNLSRLERRVTTRCSGAMSARGAGSGAASAADMSEFSVATRASKMEAPMSARVRTPASASQKSQSLGAPGARALTLNQVPEEQSLLPDGPISRWSEIAKYSRAVEYEEEKTKQQKKRREQAQMAKDLEVQIATKRAQSGSSKHEEQRFLEHQEVELERWKADQQEKQDSVRQRALLVQKERELQNAQNNRRREEEKQMAAEEEGRLVRRAAEQIDQEKDMISARKVVAKQRQSDLQKGMKEVRDRRQQDQEDKVAFERMKVQEYQDLLKEQEARNKQNIPSIRGVGAVIKAPPGGKKGREFYSEENVLKQLETKNMMADMAEQEKIKTKKEQKLSNQDFIFSQIAERNKNRERELERKKQSKTDAQVATEEYMSTEKRRIETAKDINERYRVDLEKQITAKKAKAPDRNAGDFLSPNEKAVNRHLIQDAEDLRQKWSASLEGLGQGC